MKRYFLHIQAMFKPEIMERIMRVVRHRGFELYYLKMSQYLQNEKKINLYIIILGSRSIDSLITQLKKIIDIIHINFKLSKKREIANCNRKIKCN